MKRKLLAWLLVLSMLVTFVPVSGMAATDDQGETTTEQGEAASTTTQHKIPITIQGDLKANDNTESAEVLSVNAGDSISLTAAYDVTNLKEAIKNGIAKYGTDYQLTTDQDGDKELIGEFSVTFTLPEGMTLLNKPTVNNVTVDNKDFELTWVNQDGQNVYATMTLNIAGIDTLDQLVAAVEKWDDTLSVTIQGVQIEPTVEAGTYLTVLSDVDGSAFAYNVTNSETDSSLEVVITWDAEQTEAGRDVYAATSGQDDSVISFTVKTVEEVATEIPKSKTVTALDADNRSTVTLSFLDNEEGSSTEAAYTVSKGSALVDYIGYGDDYNFEFVNDTNAFYLTVGGEKLTPVDITEQELASGKNTFNISVYGFGTPKEDEDGDLIYPFVLHYVPEAENMKETLGLAINKDVTAAVQLVYQVELSEKSSKSGVYGQLDLDGDGYIDGEDGVAVDESKAVYPSFNTALLPDGDQIGLGYEAYAQTPSVTYTVKKHSGSGGGGSAVSTHTLTFDTNGGTAVDSVKKTSGVTVNLADYTTTREGYTFAGWYSDEALTEAISEVVLDQNTTVYAKWTAAGDGKFVDVTTDDYFYDAVNWAVENNITSGVDATHFAPEDIATRAQAVTFLWRVAGSPEPTGTDNPFSDVQPTDYYYDAVLWAVEQGITVGTSDTTFSPDMKCSRAHVVSFLWRQANEPAVTDTDNPFADVQPDAYYYDAVLWAVEQGITAGTGDTTFSPDQDCNRAQIVTFLYRQANA